MQAPKENYSSITKLNQSNTFGKKDLLMSFMKVTMKTKMFKCQNNNSNDKESDREVSYFLSSEDLCDE